jgi:Flp pilus assembly protein TadG
VRAGIRSIAALLRRLRDARSGIALIEFAILVPVLICFYFGAIEVTQTVTAKRKVNLVAETVGDLTARNDTISLSTLNDIFGASSSIMNPVSTTNLTIRVSSVIVSPLGTTCVDWSRVSGSGLTALTPGTSYNKVPTALQTISITNLQYRDYVVVEATIPFQAATHRFINGSIQLSEGPTFLVPRKSDRVLADSSIQPSSPCAFN